MSPPEPEEALLNPFSGMTGRGVKVAVIDSGVNPGHPHIAPLAGGVAVTASLDIEAGEYLDRLGHGTAVMAAIQEKAPDAEYYAVRVFHSSLATSAASLVRAIDWCVEQQIDIVNLSLGTVNSAHREAFAGAVLRASQAGTLLVAAREADSKLCYPGCLPGVLSVGLDANCPRDTFRANNVGGDVVFYASGYPRPVPGVPPSRNLSGISFAVANMSSFVVLAYQAAGVTVQRNTNTSRISELLLAAAR